jgi:Zn-dependent protease
MAETSRTGLPDVERSRYVSLCHCAAGSGRWVIIFLLVTWNLASTLTRTHPGWGAGPSLSLAVASALLFFGSVLVHELAHTLVAIAQGLPAHNITLFIGVLGWPRDRLALHCRRYYHCLRARLPVFGIGLASGLWLVFLKPLIRILQSASLDSARSSIFCRHPAAIVAPKVRYADTASRCVNWSAAM